MTTDSILPAIALEAFQRVPGSFLHQQGFVVSRSSMGLLYLRFGVFLEVRYDEPCLVLEMGERHYKGNEQLARIPHWHSLSHHVEQTQRMWNINGGLEAILLGIRVDCEKAAEKHLWLSQDALEMVIGVPTLPVQIVQSASAFPQNAR